MFSEALKIMDRNTTKYMFDEFQDTIVKLRNDNNEKAQTIEEQNQLILKLKQDNEELRKKMNSL